MDNYLQIPSGVLTWEGDSAFRLIIKDFRKRAQIEQILNEFAQLKDSYWLVPKLKVFGNEIHLFYENSLKIYPLTIAGVELRNEPQINALCWFQLLYCLQEAYAVASYQFSNVLPLSPATVFVIRDNDGDVISFRFALIPIFQPGLKDWANASALSWQWINKAAFFSSKDFTISYATVAALYFCVAGCLVPESLPKQEQFFRFLAGRTGNVSAFQNHLQESLPNSMREEGAFLSEQLGFFLNQRSNKTINLPDIVSYISNNLNTRRIATRWEYEGNYELAIQMWLLYGKWHGETEVPWNKVADLYEKLKQFKNAEQALLKSLKLRQDDSFREFTKYLLLKARGMPKIAFEELVPLIHQGDTIAKDAFGEVYKLQTAHLFLKYNNNIQEATQRLSIVLSDNWLIVQCNLLNTKIALQVKDLRKVSKVCRESIKLLEQEPMSSEQNLSALTYFYLMDAIANFYAIAKLNEVSYIKDSFRLFVKSMETAIKNDDQEMVLCAGCWLNWIKNYVIYFPDDLKIIVQLGIEAFFEVQKNRGINLSEISGTPTVPWYSEDLLFTTS
ncbi:hypothetical protein [Rufibacter aurantiacus]|uniref:hypothetical protein n=1 Tax=Rufibacter aurantiacus TaxID=2817374 RepID=UPI001B305346|nr:hypothetical protein [Rufibacter aurantiacus]